MGRDGTRAPDCLTATETEISGGMPRRAICYAASGSFACLALVLLVGLVRRAFSFVVFPDELHALDAIGQWVGGRGGTLPQNYHGYGSSWWLLLSAVFREFRPTLYFHLGADGKTFPMVTPSSTVVYATIFAGRLCSVAALLAAVAYAAFTGKHLVNRLLVCGILVLPLVWWNGKWLSPDFFAIGCAIVAASLLTQRSNLWALFFLGAAVGLRLSNLATLSGFFALAALGQPISVHSLVRSAAAALAGYVAANPYIVTNFPAALHNAVGMAELPVRTWDNTVVVVGRSLFGNHLEWDLAATGSIVHWWGGLLLPAALMLGLCHEKKYRVLAAILGSFLLGLAAVGFRGLGYGWYFSPTVAASYVLAVKSLDFQAWSVGLRRAALAVFCMALAASGATSWQEHHALQTREAELLRYQQNAAFFQQAVNEMKANDTLLLLVDAGSTMFELPQVKFANLHESLAMLADPASLNMSRSLVVSTVEMERQSSDIRRFLQYLREHGARVTTEGDLIIAR